MKDIEDRLKEEYDKVEVPEYMFDTSRVFNRVKEEKKKNKYTISIVACVLLIIIVTLLSIIIIPKSNDNEIQVTEKSENINYRNVTAISKDSSVDAVINNVAIIKVEKIIDYIIIDRIPYTKVKAKVLNCYLGDLNEEIELFIPGGVFTVKDIKEKIKYDQIDDLSNSKDEELVNLTYYNEIYIPTAKEENIYITTLKIINESLFVNMNPKYGFKEYDPETNIVKADMGDEQLDIDRYLESINI